MAWHRYGGYRGKEEARSSELDSDARPSCRAAGRPMRPWPGPDSTPTRPSRASVAEPRPRRLPLSVQQAHHTHPARRFFIPLPPRHPARPHMPFLLPLPTPRGRPHSLLLLLYLHRLPHPIHHLLLLLRLDVTARGGR
ncbi:hypothetical protein PVAP13_4KG334488 [Panicum virgatum]|uniref:Uncharacterized protein n=1 Tax=Panicum virgatum TaxID=38727 RepID=A0A8T0TVU9_PANVG|nr:hypothetical protein PVAP13_4KG334488 [Panicum virgatum]